MADANFQESNSLHLFRLMFFTDMKWKHYIESIVTSAARKVCSLCRARQFFSPESILYIYKSTISPCIEYCCHIWSDASARHLEILDKIQILCNFIGPDLVSRLQSLSNRRNVISLCFEYFHDNCYI